MTTTARWLQEAVRQLRRGKHLILHGNVRDLSVFRGEFLLFSDALDAALDDAGYRLRCQYSTADGVTFAESAMRSQFEKLTRPPELQRTSAGGGYRPPGRREAPAEPPPLADPGAGPPLHLDLDQALLALRRALTASTAETLSAVLHFSDKLVTSGENQSAGERNILVLLSLMATEAHRHTSGQVAGMRNALILVAPSLGQVPAWLYRDNPLFQVVAVNRPDADERKEFLLQQHSAFFAAQGRASEALQEEFSSLTDGLSYWDLEAVRLASHHERLPLSGCKKLIDFFKHGLRDDPWEKLSLEMMQRARRELSEKVIGQDPAIQSVIDVLVSARGGVQLEGAGRRSMRPKGVLFFVGPTGVGKTELAKALTELVFHDPAAFARFDMSEFAQEHAAERLTGAPPSYVGYEAGGQLTNRMKTRPFSLILLDEIEKAHPRVLDKFLQVLDDGRLTDGLGETVYFSQSVIVFTSNIGSTRVDRAPGGAEKIVSAIRPNMTYEEIASHYLDEVREHFIRMGRPEILGRIGEENIVPFDMLREAHIDGILAKFLRGVSASAMERHHVEVVFDESVMSTGHSFCARQEVISFGGRGVRNFVQSRVLTAINEAMLRLQPGQSRLVCQSLDGTLVVE